MTRSSCLENIGGRNHCDRMPATVTPQGLGDKCADRVRPGNATGRQPANQSPFNIFAKGK